MSATMSSRPAAGTRVERPANTAEAAELLRGSRGSLLFRGGGTKMSWGARPLSPDLLVDTGGLDQLIAHNPADMTASVQAGMPLRDLQAALEGSGQWLALDPPTEAGGATVGGLLASGDFGPRRVRYGGMRDLVIGITLVLADGTAARSGGTVIKNVAGYDLAKLVYGSLGSLGLITEVAVRLHPLPKDTATLLAPASAERATAAALALLASPLEPAALDWVGATGEEGRFAVRFEGSPAGVDAQLTTARQLLSGAGVAAEELRAEPETGLWTQLAAARYESGPAAGTDPDGDSGTATAFAGVLPSATPALEDALRRAGQSAGVGTSLASSIALGLHVARFTGAAEGIAAAFDAWRGGVLGMGGSVLLRERPPAVDERVDPMGQPPSALPLLRAVKARLDPEGRCAPGRFGSWY